MLILYGEAWSPDIYYRCGFRSDTECLYVEDGKKRALYVPGFEYERAVKEVTRVKVRRLTRAKTVLGRLSGPFTIPARFPYALAEHLRGKKIVVQEPFPERRIKTPEEIEYIAAAQDAARECIAMLTDVLSHASVRAGVAYLDENVLTSEYLKGLARGFLIERGYDCPELIISSGEQTGLPHHRGTGPIHEGPVVLDVFPQSDETRYFGDMTRTVIVGGDVDWEMTNAILKDVHDACAARCVPGARAQDIHAFAVAYLAERGFATTRERGLIHALGHGVGLAVHESPRISTKSNDVLGAGMVVTIEPGVYDVRGARYENAVVVDVEPRVL